MFLPLCGASKVVVRTNISLQMGLIYLETKQIVLLCFYTLSASFIEQYVKRVLFMRNTTEAINLRNWFSVKFLTDTHPRFIMLKPSFFNQTWFLGIFKENRSVSYVKFYVNYYPIHEPQNCLISWKFWLVGFHTKHNKFSDGGQSIPKM